MKIEGMITAVPNQKVESSERISKHVGIRYRNLTNEETTSLDLCFVAAKELLKELDINPNSIECLISVTQTPDFRTPINSCILQSLLGCPTTTAAIDIPLGCSGYTYALLVVNSFLRSGQFKNCLLLVGDTVSKLVDSEDVSTKDLFGDAGTATYITSGNNEIIFDFGTDGSKSESIIVRGGGMKITNKKQELQMEGVQVFEFATNVVPKSIEKICPDLSKCDYLVLHQANKLINNTISRLINLDSNKVLSSLEFFGNTNCATIPVTLCSNFEKQIIDSKNLILSGFGVGLSWCSVYLPNQTIKFGEILYV